MTASTGDGSITSPQSQQPTDLFLATEGTKGKVQGGALCEPARFNILVTIVLSPSILSKAQI